MSQQQQSVKVDAVPRLQLFNCVHVDCGATFTRRWRLEEHETTHTGAVSFESVISSALAVTSVSRSVVKTRTASCGKTFTEGSARRRYHERAGEQLSTRFKGFECARVR